MVVTDRRAGLDDLRGEIDVERATAVGGVDAEGRDGP
jgi:hypothetical protein